MNTPDTRDLSLIEIFLNGTADQRWEAVQALPEHTAKVLLSIADRHRIAKGTRDDVSLTRAVRRAKRDQKDGEYNAANRDYTLDDEGCVRWDVNGSVPPSDTHFWMQVALRGSMSQVEAIMKVGARETKRVLAEYRANATFDPEAQAQADATGETVVNIITGQTYHPA